MHCSLYNTAAHLIGSEHRSLVSNALLVKAPVHPVTWTQLKVACNRMVQDECCRAQSTPMFGTADRSSRCITSERRAAEDPTAGNSGAQFKAGEGVWV